jgi:hypothetical protein
MTLGKRRNRMSRMIRLLLAFAAIAVLACGPPSQHEILKQADGVETKQALEEAIGAPDEVDKLGPMEKWIYRASDGDVEFVITGDKVRLGSTKDRDEEEEGTD